MKSFYFYLLLAAFLLSGMEMVMQGRKTAFHTKKLASFIRESRKLQESLMADFQPLSAFPAQVEGGTKDIENTSQAIDGMVADLEAMKKLTSLINKEVASITSSTTRIKNAAGVFQKKLLSFSQTTEALQKSGSEMIDVLENLNKTTGKMVESLEVVKNQMKRETILKLLKSLKKK